MRLSIVMATWMGERYLREQLDSFARQKRLPDELVVRDDGSTDSTLQIVRDFARRASFDVKILATGPRLGFGRNFGEALVAATGDLIFLSDQDDVWLSDKLQRIEQLASERTDALLFVNDLENVGPELQRTDVTTLGNIRQVGLSDSTHIAGCATAVRRSLLAFALPLPRNEASHDGWLHVCAETFGRRVVVPEVLQLYRRHDTNTSDWAPTRTGRMSFVKLYQESLRNDRLRSHRLQLVREKDLLQRLTEADAVTLETLCRDRAAAFGRVERRVAALEGRVGVLTTPWPGRWRVALRMWMRGGYDDFIGWRSMVSDLLSTSKG
ncbi:glycosyltransferase family 2 protein [Aromatoleum toluclasticum]|uniref:glycosyltransferase family 2 protein n=1 Tax=Aromatoleum toluclasticum TaxID=92003 RepID=UPI001D18E0C6|nr:glycosyltransferase family 2 protein [Aromatoleum toluclasticum]MCC4114264.1 glycosyltransferase family 2 protein [Aromatoleum toluclasticum]